MVKCDCKSHAIEVEFFVNGFISVLFWYEGHVSKTLRQKLNMVWRVLTNKRLEYEEFLLRSEDARKLADQIRAAADEADNNNTGLN